MSKQAPSKLGDIFKDLYPKIDQKNLPEIPDVQLTEVETLSSKLGFSIWHNIIDIKKDCHYQVNIPAGLYFSFCFGGEMQTQTNDGIKGDMTGYMQNLLYIPTQSTMTTYIPKQPTFLAFGISLTPEFIQRQSHAGYVARLLIQQMSTCFQTLSLQPEIQQLIESLSKKSINGPGALLVAEGMVLQILGYWLALGKAEHTTNFPNAPQVMKVKSSIDQKVKNWLTPERYAQKVALSHQVLNHGFKQLFKQSLHAYIQQRKLKVGHDLLLLGYKVSQIAYQLDFSPQYFSELFKQRFGTSPKQFQQKNRKNITNT